MELPEEDLLELGDILDSGKLQPLRARFDKPRRVRQQLSRYTDRIFLFPFGIRPDPGQAIDVYCNGMLQWSGEEIRVVRVGKVTPLSVLVVDYHASNRDVIEAIYVAIPETDP